MIDILLIPHHHFDPTWRRCFDRPATKNGLIVRSYADVEEACIERFLKLAPKGYPFSEGQAAVWRTYLRRHPERLPLLRKLADKGQLDVMLAGETVQDTNFPAAEGLVRNFLCALPLYETLCGPNHRGLKLGWVEDAFGNSPNYPQILKGVGAEVACVISYRRLPNDVWQGIDGTRIPCYDNAPKMFVGAFQKLPPCAACRGKGCAECENTGLFLFDKYDIEGFENAIQKIVDGSLDKDGKPPAWAVMSSSIEEVIPDARLCALVGAMNKKHAGKARVRFANPSDQYAQWRDKLQALAAEKGDGPSPDLSPGMPGCQVSRIRCKQRSRAVAYELVQAESAQAAAAWQKGKPRAPLAAMNDAWRKVAFTQFHDAITGTHIDHAFRELMDMLDAAEKTALKNGAPKPAPEPAFGKPAKNALNTVRLGNLEITYDLIGIKKILVGGKDLCGTVKPYAPFKRDIRPAELVLDVDIGDAWGQRVAPFIDVAATDSQIPLGDYNESVAFDGEALRWRGRYRGGCPQVKILAWTITCRASQDGQRLDFTTDVDWDTHSMRLRVFFPVKSQEKSATYEVPFGFTEREFDASKLDYSQWMANSMEFPTLHWIRRRVGNGGVAVFNKGLPCNRWIPGGRLEISLVRSPEWFFCSEDPGCYEFWDTDGQRDTGKHRFEYSLWPHAGAVDEHTLTQTGYAYNNAAPTHPFAIRGNAIATAFKLAEDGKGWILRVQETAGTGGDVVIDFGREVTSCPTNLLEQPAGEAAVGATRALKLRPHEICTVKIAV